MTKRPILILTTSAGAGHTAAARAIESAVQRFAPDETVEVHDLLQSTNAFFRNLYAGGYLQLAQHAPNLLGLIYESTDHRRPVSDWLRTNFQHTNSRGARRYLLSRNPKLVINTHFYSAEVVARLRRSGRLDCPQVTVTTDFDTHRMWVQQPSERYYAATEDGRKYLTSFGVPAASVRVTGIPIRPGFLQEIDPDAFRGKHGLDPRRPLVLLLCGGFGVGPTEDLFQQLLSLPDDIQVVVICGRNEKLRARLEHLGAGRPTVKALGFSDEMHGWMQSADLAVTKPGGLTASEALASGLPLVIVHPIPGQESRNSDYLLENGAAIKVNSFRMLAVRVGELLEDRARLRALATAARKLAHPAAADEIAQDALRLIGCLPQIRTAPVAVAGS